MVATIESGVSLHGAYRLTLSDLAPDTAWDIFLDSGKHSHVQSSLWGKLKAASGWQVRRVKVEDGNGVVGGAQLLFRRVPVLGRIGYVSKGPVLDVGAPGLYRALLNEVLRMAATEGLRYLIVQPEDNSHGEGEQILTSGFQPGVRAVGPTATVLVDLSPSEEDLFAAMNTGTRRNVRTAQRSGIVVRQGSKADLPAFYRLLCQTATRQEFTPEPYPYYDQMWDVFHTGGHIEMFVSEYEGKPLGALIALAFGDTVVYKRAGWSGEMAKMRPNQILLWTSICRARAGGYRYYDLEGIDRHTAEAALANTPIAIENSDTYKLTFGGNVVLLPTAYSCFPSGRFAGLSQRVVSALQTQPMFDRFAKSLRAT
jgi:lipid II:glycine glycyltransferase (peptidoglycan interpeptide bridge formation enzyme)